MADTENVIAGALAEAREEGVLPENTEDVITPAEDEGVDEPAVNTGDEPTTGDEPVGDDEPKEGDGPKEGDEPPAPKEGDEPPVVKDEKTPKTLEEDLREMLGPEKDGKGQNNKIPYHRVLKIVPNLVAKAMEPTVLGLAQDLGIDPASASLETIRKTVQNVAERVSSMDTLEPIMASDGDAFIKILASSNPEQYSKFLAVLDPAFKPSVAGDVKDDDKDDPMPAPDMTVTLPDGSKGKTYSVEGDAKRIEWLQRKITKDVMAGLDTRIKPFEDAKRAKDGEVQSRQELARELKSTIAEMEEFEGFTENKEAIQTYMREKVDLKIPFRKAVRLAYNAVVIQGFKVSKAKAREEAQAELRKAPKSTSVPNGGAPPKRKANTAVGEDGEVVGGTEAVIRNAVAAAKAAGTIR